VIHIREGAFAVRVTMILRPTTDLEVEALNQFARRQHRAPGMNKLTNLGQERTHILARRFHQDPPVGVPSQVLTKKVDAVFPMRDTGFLVGERQPSFGQEVSHERLDFLL
jgi:hypothetical protein